MVTSRMTAAWVLGWVVGGGSLKHDRGYIWNALSPEHSKMVPVTLSGWDKITRLELLLLAIASMSYLCSPYWWGPLDPRLLAYEFH